MSLGKHLLRGSGANLLDLLIKTAAVFVTTPLLLKTLGTDGYGSWVLIMSVIGYFLLVDMGMTFSATRFIAMAVGAGDESRQALLMETMLRFFRMAALVVIGLTAVMVPALPWIMPETDHSQHLIPVLLICAGGAALRLYFRSSLVLLRAHVRYDLQAWSSILRTCLQTPALYWTLTHGHGLMGAAVCQASGECIELLAQRLFARSLSKPQRGHVSIETLKQVRRELFVYSRSIVMGSVGDSLRLEINPFLIARMSGVDQVPVYSIGLRLITMLQDIVNAIFGGQLLAAFSQLHGGDEKEKLKEGFLKISQITSGFSACAMLGAVWIAHPFLERWVGNQVAPAHQVMLIFSLPFALHFMQYPAYNLLYTFGKTNWIVMMLVVGGVISLVLGALLGLKWGITGIVAGAAVVKLVERGFLVPWFVHRCIGVPVGRYMINSMYWPALKAMLFPALYAWLTLPFLQPEYPRLFLLGGGFALVFFLSFPWMVLDSGARQMLWRLSFGRFVRR